MLEAANVFSTIEIIKLATEEIADALQFTSERLLDDHKIVTAVIKRDMFRKGCKMIQKLY
jgi:hypothetical protein